MSWIKFFAIGSLLACNPVFSCVDYDPSTGTYTIDENGYIGFSDSPDNEDLKNFRYYCSVKPDYLTDHGVMVAFKHLENAEEILQENKDQFDPAIVAGMEGLFSGIRSSLAKDKNWGEIFYISSNIIRTYILDVKKECAKELNEKIQINTELLKKIYSEIAISWGTTKTLDMNFSTNNFELTSNQEKTTSNLKSEIKKISFVEASFTTMEGDELEDEFYECYRQLMFDKCQIYAKQSLVELAEANLILEKMPYFTGKDLIKGLVIGTVSSFMSGKDKTKAVLIAGTCVFKFIEKFVDSTMYIYDHVNEYYDCIWLAWHYSAQQDKYQEWLWTN